MWTLKTLSGLEEWKHTLKAYEVWKEISMILNKKAILTTQRRYLKDLERFMKWSGFDPQGESYDPIKAGDYLLSVDYKKIEAYVEWLKTIPGTPPKHARVGEPLRGLAPATIATYVAFLATIYARLQFVGLVTKNPVNLKALDLPSVKIRKVREVEPLSDLCMAAMIKHTEGGSLLKLRDRAILEVFFYGGLRLDEVCSLRVGNLSSIESPEGTTEGVWIIAPKGKVDSFQALSGASMDIIRAYLKERGKLIKLSHDHFLFAGKGGVRGGFTPNGLYRRFKSIAKAAGYPEAHPHAARHSAVGRFYRESGGDIALTREFARHKNIATTVRYIGAQKSRVASIIRNQVRLVS